MRKSSNTPDKSSALRIWYLAVVRLSEKAGWVVARPDRINSSLTSLGKRKFAWPSSWTCPTCLRPNLYPVTPTPPGPSSSLFFQTPGQLKSSRSSEPSSPSFMWFLLAFCGLAPAPPLCRGEGSRTPCGRTVSGLYFSTVLACLSDPAVSLLEHGLR